MIGYLFVLIIVGLFVGALGRLALPGPDPMGIGQTIDVPVVVHNWSAKQQTGAVSLDLPANFTVDAQAKPYDLAPGADATVTFKLTNTDTTVPAQQNVAIPIRTSYGEGEVGRRRSR